MLKISIHAKNMLFLRPIMLKIEALMSKNDTFMLTLGTFMLAFEGRFGSDIGQFLPYWDEKREHIAPLITCWLMRLTAFYNWHKHLHCILTSLGSLVCLAHHLNLLLLHTILAHLRILANAHLVTGTLLRSTITDMARYNVELLYHDWTKIGNVADCYS